MGDVGSWGCLHDRNPFSDPLSQWCPSSPVDSRFVSHLTSGSIHRSLTLFVSSWSRLPVSTPVSDVRSVIDSTNLPVVDPLLVVYPVLLYESTIQSLVPSLDSSNKDNRQIGPFLNRSRVIHMFGSLSTTSGNSRNKTVWYGKISTDM